MSSAESEELEPGLPETDRRREDRRSAWVRLADYPIPELRKGLLTALLLVAIFGLFLYMVHDVLVAGIAGIVLGVYLIPFQRWLRRRIGNRHVTAIVTITLVTVPLVIVLAYSWLEISRAADYLQSHRSEVADRLNQAIQALPLTPDVHIEARLSRLVAALARQTTDIVSALREAIDIVVLSVTVLLFTTYYILTDADRIGDYVGTKVPGRYRTLAGVVTQNVRSVIYGALYATFFTQIVKSAIILGLNLAFDVPLAVVLAIVSFFIGFFPIVGSWSVYVPVAIYLMAFQHRIWPGAAVLIVGFVVNTLLLSMYLRPKIAAQRSHILNFYWMFIALVTGVYTFGIIGIVIGPVLIAVLKAVFDSITSDEGSALVTSFQEEGIGDTG